MLLYLLFSPFINLSCNEFHRCVIDIVLIIIIRHKKKMPQDRDWPNYTCSYWYFSND